MEKIVLENFNTMTSGYKPGVNKRLLHRFIQGFVPHYMFLADEASDANFKQKINPAYPLVLSPAVTTIVSKADKYPVVIIPNDRDTLSNAIYSTDLWEFFIDDSSETSLGIPNGTPASNVNITAIMFNGKILTGHPLNSSLYHGAVNATPAWTASTGVSLSTGFTKVLKLFEDRCLVTDASSGAFTRRDAVRIVLPDFSIIDGIELGDTFDIQDVGNYQDRQALLFTRRTTSPRLSKGTTVFTWNGVAGDPYDVKHQLRGRYKCSIERDGAVYAFTQIGTTLTCYEYNGAGFREVGKLTNVSVPEHTGAPSSRIGIEGDFFVILASSSGNTTNTAPLYWNPFTGEAFFLVKAISSLPLRVMMIALNETTGLYSRYFSYQNGASVGFLYKVTMENSTKADMGANYKSNFIPMPIVKGIHDGFTMGRGNIVKVEIEYSTIPPSSSDIIGFTLTSKDEHTSETYNSDTATIKNTTANSSASSGVTAAVTSKRAIIKIGRKCTEFAIDLAITVATTSWDLIIRRIVIYYEPIAISE